jgi:CheY-like chemotaxis protein
LAHGKRYGGTFDAALFVELRDRLVTARIPLSAAHFSKIEVSLTWNGERQIACLRWLPVVQVAPLREESALYSSALPHTPTTPCNRTILLVDDDPWFTTTVANALSLKSWEVSVCNSAGEALKRLEREAPTIIICDIHMPEMDGVMFVRTLRRRGRDSALLVLTSDEDPLREAELILLGIDAFVRKNADPQILLAWCQNLLARENQRRTFQR